MNVGMRPCIVRGKYNRVQRIKLMLIIASFDGRISLELRHLATFRTLATTLNFTQTAALLGSVQSSVSAQIQELEAELGVLVFDRLNRRVILTDEGQRLREHFLMFPRFGNALAIVSEYCEERYEEALAAYRQASECSASEPSSYEKQAQVLEKWASTLRKRAMGLRS